MTKQQKEPIFMLKNISSNYVKTLILSNLPKNFTEVGKFNCISADTMHRRLNSINYSHQEMLKLAQAFFIKSKVLYLVNAHMRLTIFKAQRKK